MSKKLARYVHVPDENGDMVAFGPDDQVPAWAAKKITNPSAWAEDESDTGDSADDSEGGAGEPEKPVYRSMKKAELEAEVATRNEGRAEDDLIEVGGNGTVADLVAALESDDAAQADSA